MKEKAKTKSLPPKASDLKRELKLKSSKKRKESNERFFKTGKGDYGEGDKFIGVSVPDIRKIAKDSLKISLAETQKLIKSTIHEERLLALVILILKYEFSGLNKLRKQIVNFYLKNIKHVNNWDLVDISAPKILGRFYFNQSLKHGRSKQSMLKQGGGDLKKSLKEIYKLSESNILWQERIAILSTYYFITQGEFNPTLRLAKKFINHNHDLIHKAVGWMLREIGKKDQKALIKFLDQFYPKMPRTMLRYSIEKFPQNLRQKYLNK